TLAQERIVRVDQFATDFEPEGHILFARNVNRPGMIGRVGTILGDAGVNIGHMDVGPLASPVGAHGHTPASEALMVLSVDDAVPSAAIEEIRRSADIFGITSVVL
ncbi:MAG: ACT domain-containing protein, partial [Ktedonobacterales bacterium]